MGSFQIKFRAWDKEKEEWAGADYWYEGVGLNFNVTPPSALTMSGKETHVLMQYTGLKDINGVEIYEGDIVKWGHLNQWSREQPHRIAEVKFNPDIQFHSQVGVFNFGSFAYRDTTETDLEVIGNVYEDKELLEVD